MGRCKSGVQRQELPDESIHTYAAHFMEYVEAQEDGLAFFGEAVYPNKRRSIRAPAFYPYRIDPTAEQGENKASAVDACAQVFFMVGLLHY
jgi:hypothetical protein